MLQIWLLITALLTFSVPAWGAAITSAQSGNWSDTATWVDGAPPGVGDSFVIADTHVVTVIANVTTGDTSTTNTVRGALVINQDVVFTNNAPFTLSNSSGSGALTMHPGSTLDMSGGAYNFYHNSGFAGSTTSNLLGTAVKRVWIKGGTGRFQHTQPTGGMTLYWRYADLTGFTNASGNVLGAYTSMDIQNCLFKDTIRWTIGTLSTPAGTQYIFNNNDIRNSASISGRMWEFQKNNSDSTNTVSISGNTFVGNSPTTLQVVYVAGGYFKPTAQANNNVIYDAIWQAGTFLGSMDGNIGFHSAAVTQADQPIFNLGLGGVTFQQGIVAGYNPNSHGITNATSADNGDIIIQNSVLELYNTGASTPNMLCPSGPQDITIRRNLFLGEGNGILAALVSSAGALTVANNTFYCNLPGDPALSFEFAGYRTGYTKFSSNFVYDLYASTFISFKLISGSNTADEVDEADYNAFKGPNSETLAKYYQLTNAASLGTHDLSSTDPQFVDPSRTLGGYAHSLNPALSTLTHFADEAVKRNGFDKTGAPAAYTSGFDAASAITWVRAGFTPTNSSLLTTGESGSYIGAVQPIIVQNGKSRKHQFNFANGFRF